jgi:hypothetical protein
MITHRINTLAELQAEQDRLVGNMRIIRKEFTRSAEETTSKGRDFLLHNVLLPVGAIGLGAFVAKKLTDMGGSDEKSFGQTEPAAEENSNGWFSKLMLVALPLVQQYFVNAKTAEPTASSAPSDEQHYDLQANGGGGTGWHSTVALMAIPLLQQYFLQKAANESEHSIKLELDGSEVLDGTMANRKSTASVIFETLYKLLPVVLPMVQQFFAAGNNRHGDDAANDVTVKNGQRTEVAA